MDLKLHDVIVGPLTTEKANAVNQKFKKLALNVHIFANKIQIKEALQKLFDIRVKDVNVLVRKGKKRRVGRKFITSSKKKIAIVSLHESSGLGVFGDAASQQGIAPVNK
ncbi:MAG: 50S ribosomal protein L23 [Candidatus Babeliales bacterium]